MRKHIFIMGSRGYEKNYGGWETFVDNLIKNSKNMDTQFYVSEITDKKKQKALTKNNVICPQIYIPKIGHARMVLFAYKALKDSLQYVIDNDLKNVIFYILGVRIGPVFWVFRKKLDKYNIKVIINPDGLEWKRAKWNWLIKKYFLFSERTMIKSSDHVICDSNEIKRYVDKKYKNYNVDTTYIPYGAYLSDMQSHQKNQKTIEFLSKHDINLNNYYLIVGRFVPENNYELIIKEFLVSDTKKDLVIVTNVQKNKFYRRLLNETRFDKDERIKFVGPVYDKNMLDEIRHSSFAYVHGHSAGGTNPSLLESMAISKLCLIYGINFNKEVGGDLGLYFYENIKDQSLSVLISKVEKLGDKEILAYSEYNKNIIENNYNWKDVAINTNTIFNSLIDKDRKQVDK